MVKLKIKKAEKEDVYRDIIRIPEKYRKDLRNKVIEEGSICLITIKNRKVYAILRGSLNSDSPEAKIDDRLRGRLGVKVEDEVEIILRKASIWVDFIWACYSTDPIYRIPIRLSLISVVVGVMGLTLAIISLIK